MVFFLASVYESGCIFFLSPRVCRWGSLCCGRRTKGLDPLHVVVGSAGFVSCHAERVGLGCG